METPGPSTSTSGDTIWTRGAVYSKQFTKSLQRLLNKCRTDANVGSLVEPSKPAKVATEAVKSTVSYVASCVAPAKASQWLSTGCESAINEWFSKLRKEDCIRLVDRLRSVSNKELRKMSVHAPVQLFASFECQFMSVCGSEGSWAFDLEKLADDGAYRAVNYLLAYKGELVINEKVIIQGVLRGESICTGTLNSVVNKNLLPHAMRPGYPVKLGDTEMRTYQLYERTGIVVLSENGGGDRFYGKSDTVLFRRKFSWEEESEFPKVSPRRNTYSYVINESLAEEMGNKILNEINDCDENIIRSKTLAGVNTGLQNQKTMQQTLDANGHGINLILETLTSSSKKKTEFDSTMAFVKDLVKIPDVDWRDEETVQWNRVVTGILGALQCKTDRGRMVAIYSCEPHDANKHGFAVNVIAVEENFYDRHVSSVLEVSGGMMRIKTLKEKNKSHLEYPVSDVETSFTVVVGSRYLSAETTATEQVFLLVTEDEPVSSYQTRLKMLSNVTSRMVKWGDIGEAAQNRVLQNGKVQIQGRLYDVRDAYEYLEGEQLNTLLRGEILQLFGNHNVPVKIGYRDRWIEIEDEDVSEHLKGDDVVVLNLMREVIAESEVVDKDAAVKKTMQRYLDTHDISTEKLTWKDCEYEFAVEESKGVYKNKNVRLRKYDTLKHDVMFLFPERELISTSRGKITFISAIPGDGKTSLLQHIHSNFSVHGYVSIFITALDLHQELVSRRDATVMETLTAALKISRLEAEVLRRMKIVLLLDAFDEVEDSEFDKVITFVDKCMGMENIKIVVSLRSYLEGFVKNKFPVEKVYRLGSLMEEDQISIIAKWWEGEQGEREDWCDRADHLLYMLPTDIVTPLVCELFASFWLDRDLNGDETRFHLHHLYKHLIDKSFGRNLTEKLKVGSGLQRHNVSTTIQKQALDAHVNLAFKEICPKYADIFAPYMNTHTNVIITAGQGLLRHIEPPRFVHRTIAEYLVDEWVFQIITGKVEYPEVFLDKFSQFFSARYVESADKEFLEDMLIEHGVPVTFKFNIDSFHIEKISFHSFLRPLIRKMLFSSFIEFYKEKFISAVLQSKYPVGLYKMLLEDCGIYGYYDLFRLLWFEIKHLLPSLEYPSINEHSSMISIVTQSSALINTKLTSVLLEGKNQIVKTILEYDPEPVTSQPATTRFLFLEGLSIDLIESLVSVNKNLLYQVNQSRENVLHSSYQKNDFFQKFYLKFPDYFYPLINSVDRNGQPPWWKLIFSKPTLVSYYTCQHYHYRHFGGHYYYSFLVRAAPELLKTIDFCVQPKACAKIRDYHVHFPALDRARICIDHEASLNEKMVGSTVWIAYVNQQPSIPLLSAFESCVEASGAKVPDDLVKNFPNDNELSPYFVAVYIRDCVTGKRHFEPEQFEQFLMNKVLVTEGISFRHFITVYLLEMLLRKTHEEETHLQLSDMYVDSLSVNDSIFIVACKTGHVKVARLLFKSFSFNWVTCLNEFQTMFFFRALDMHCGDFINEVVEKLVEHQYVIPVRPVKEALVTGNLNLFRIYVENLGFTGERIGELSDGRGFGLMHHVLEHCFYDCCEILEKKRLLIQYISDLFPGALDHIDNQGRTTKRVDDSLYS